MQALRTKEGLQALSGVEFEGVVAKLFAKLECDVRRTPGSGDEGIDLVLLSDGAKLVVQCKRWKSDVGAAVVRDFYGAFVHSGAAHGFIVTTGRFTRSAVDFVRNKPLTLINGDMLLRWMAGSYQPRVRGYRPENAKASNGRDLDPHAVLRIARGASRDEIRAAYRREMSQYHPDKVAQLGPELQDLATLKSKQINEAYRSLMDALG